MFPFVKYMKNVIHTEMHQHHRTMICRTSEYNYIYAIEFMTVERISKLQTCEIQRLIMNQTQPLVLNQPHLEVSALFAHK